jgi:hypothetical protein
LDMTGLRWLSGMKKGAQVRFHGPAPPDGVAT